MTFCVPGDHAPDTDQTAPGILPQGWTKEPACSIAGIWYKRTDGARGIEIVVCPRHPLADAPAPAHSPLPDRVYVGHQPEEGGAGIIDVYDILGASQPDFQHWVKHSPTGYSWGCRGSGAADCARSLIAAAVGDIRAVCPTCLGTNRTVTGCGHIRAAVGTDDPARVRDCSHCDNGLLIYPTVYQTFKEETVATWRDTFVVTRAGIVGWLKARFPNGEWPDIA